LDFLVELPPRDLATPATSTAQLAAHLKYNVTAESNFSLNLNAHRNALHCSQVPVPGNINKNMNTIFQNI